MIPRIRARTVIIALFSILVMFILMNLGNQLIKSAIAKDKVAAARKEAATVADKRVKESTNILTLSGIASSSIGSSKVDVCYVTHEDSGWFATSWHQECYLRYVNGYTTNLSKDEVKKRLISEPKTVTYFGTEDMSSVSGEDLYCGLFENDYSITLIYRPANTHSAGYSCQIPSPLQGVGSVSGPVMAKDLSVETYKSFNPSTVSNIHNQIWFMHDEHYYYENLGCGIGILCNTPRAKPAHPKLSRKYSNALN